ncbi:MAG: hypothetical protein HY079_03320 [Elusimicrobia bacterium]|nr:hypothetical protein [Elusimicrobiota bacterium]
MTRTAALAVLLLPGLAPAARAGDAPGKPIVQGAPIIVDDDAPPPAPASARPAALDPAASAPVPAPSAGAPVRTPPPAALSGKFIGLPWVLGAAAAFVLYRALRRPRGPRSSFALEPGPWKPGDAVHGTLWTEKKPASVRAVCELYAADGDRPLRSAAVVVGEPRQDPDGWRTAVSAQLPADSRPGPEGGWAVSVTATVDGIEVLEGDNVELGA